MRRLLGLLSLAGALAALAMVAVCWIGGDLPAGAIVGLQLWAMAAFGAWIIASLNGAMAGVQIVVPREVLAGALIVVGLVFAHLGRHDQPSDGRAVVRGSGFAVVGKKGVVVRELSAAEYAAAERADKRITATMMLLFAYGPTVYFLAPAGFWAPGRRPRRFGDLGINATTRVRAI